MSVFYNPQPSKQVKIGMNQAENTEAEPPSFKIHILMDEDGLKWTLFRSYPMEHTRAIRQLPKPLRRKLHPILKKLSELKIRKILFDKETTPHFWIGFRRVDIPFDNYNQAIKTLELTAWWLERHRRRTIIMARMTDTNEPKHLTWRCPDCNMLTTIEQDCCNNQCSSWDKYYEATEDTVFASKHLRVISN